MIAKFLKTKYFCNHSATVLICQIRSKRSIRTKASHISTMTKKKGTKKSMDPSLLTPEYIAEQRRLREERKAKERKEKEAHGVFDGPEPQEKFIKRPFLALPNEVGNGNDEVGETPKLSVKIMSYNILAQCLIRRSLFPTNGKILKWYIRKEILLAELRWYDPDILCLQECDKLQFHNFWQSELAKLGYECKFHRYNTKNHGLVIAYKTEIFLIKHQSFIKYDQDVKPLKANCKAGEASEVNQDCDRVELPPARIQTKNVGFMCYLEFKQSVLERFPYLKQRNGVIIGTTHAFWHPFGTYDRTRQMYIILHKFREFHHTMQVLSKNKFPFYSFFTGDLNSEPFDAPYLSLVEKPVSYEGQVKNVLGCSLSYVYSSDRDLDESEDEIPEGAEHVEEQKNGREEEKKEEEKEEEKEEKEDAAAAAEDSNDSLTELANTLGINEDNLSQTPDLERDSREIERLQNPDTPEPSKFEPTEKQDRMMQQLADAHNDLPLRAISLYSAGYSLVHPDNAQNCRNEPEFSNWVDKWVGMLDYILMIVPWNKQQDTRKIDTPQDLEKHNVKIKKLLKLPKPEEMGPKPNGQPRLYQYPSDHLCIMAEIELL
ncbi:conserved hypothetical protein [Lodderomyces elongisporus NRRL YB-4239]|uniref:Endonuclease/exonuclease/phosphatase domain-containing protein n=1 Tax=Lodderomyces elongisporus (strain ATCC 11503 / CBS 2605 / JCM 1781 / NBRC 1676 / NRRL YB-4239) TaxID=379508 RepID=A5E5D6_LODEL|nr:conserved hypothetical protein [Lodderomyces elongisporus NRRL YB-4239]